MQIKFMATLTLTGIHGKVHPATGPAYPDPAAVKQLVVDLDGSYGGARETLWTARGGLDPGAHEGQLLLRAERFSLGEIDTSGPASGRPQRRGGRPRGSPDGDDRRTSGTVFSTERSQCSKAGSDRS